MPRAEQKGKGQQLTSGRNLPAEVQAEQLALRVVLRGEGVDDGGVLEEPVADPVGQAHDAEPDGVGFRRDAKLLVLDART